MASHAAQHCKVAVACASVQRQTLTLPISPPRHLPQQQPLQQQPHHQRLHPPHPPEFLFHVERVLLLLPIPAGSAPAVLGGPASKINGS